jgi:hypothetical protein
MKYLLGLLLIISTTIKAQIPKNANAIEVQGVTFREVVSRLLDSNYTIAKIDSNYQTAETAPKYWNNPYTMVVKVRVKDSTATITGTFRYGNKEDYQQGSISWIAAGSDNTIANIKQWEHKRTNPFALMNRIALSFGKPVAYQTL